LFDMVTNFHKRSFVDVFIDSIDIDQNSGASEYELYFNFLELNRESYKKRYLRFLNTHEIPSNYLFSATDYDFIALHSHNRHDLKLFI
jgi:hypothetical protein